MSEAKQTSDESPVRPVVRRDATIRSEVPARSHEVRECEAIRALEKAHRRLKYLWRCANYESLTPEEMFDRIDRIKDEVHWDIVTLKRSLPSAREAELRTQRGEG